MKRRAFRPGGIQFKRIKPGRGKNPRFLQWESAKSAPQTLRQRMKRKEFPLNLGSL